jgi:alkylation response protein AidB-like acyl-CoA dehydrogenase
MISFTPSEEQQMLIETVHRYSLNDVRPIAHDADECGDLPESVLKTGWEIGILPCNIPEAMGGLGDYSALTGALACEELAYGDLALALRLMAPALVAIPLVLDGTDAQRKEWLPLFRETPLTRRWSTRRAVRSGPSPDHATPHNDHFVLDGQKAYVPLAERASWILTYAWNPEASRVDAFFVRGDAEGVKIGPREKLMGVRALPTYQVTLNNVQVGTDCRLGGARGADFARLLAHSRVALAAMASA